ncbi:type II toxin-antitoxin system VapC family toxin [Solirhodobacter olei]|uniref:type II toxin-antitoxin system VapC family toxin n=1 Tax=Solirhodobacter olei TaxID=2493082 RepID=UPI000FDB2514|nr:type II toxin-antitoxin system VapC family toxin [Solirhodobacter olei]
MFIDSSAFMAMLLGEAEAGDLLLRLTEHRRKPVTTPIARYEVVVSLARSRAEGRAIAPEDLRLAEERFDTLLEILGCSEIMVTAKIGRMAIETAATYGKVAGHPAKLNMGDCMSYAAAKASGIPLLYKGEDFAQTDLG